MLQGLARRIAADTACCGQRSTGRVGVCCVNMDAGTPDDNIFAMFDVVQRYRAYGA